jgi:nucleoside-diphosphate-sugar epimerase
MVHRRVVKRLIPALALARRLHPRFPLPIGPGPLRFLATSRFVDIGRARAELGYAPSIGYREGLAQAMAGINGSAIRGEPTHAAPA